MLTAQEDPQNIGEWNREGVLGKGGFGEVVLWKNVQTRETIAVKKCFIINNDPDSRQKQEERWKKEVEFMMKIQNDYIVKAKDPHSYEFLSTLAKPTTNPSQLPLLAMEYCDGGDLRSQLNLQESVNGLKEKDVRALLLCLRKAIAYLHGCKIIHRDIKPENVVIQAVHDEKIYKLTDLGYAKSLEETVKSLVGTLEYLAPELFENCRSYTKTVDFWSFGIITFEAICGYRPFIPHQTVGCRMLQQKNKKSHDICITEDNEGKFTFHQSLPPENSISDTLKHSLQEWLKLALEIYPEERGGPCDSDGTSYAIFSNLDDLLERKILTIFSLCTYQVLSFEIKNSVSVGCLYKWLSEKLNKKEDELFIIPPADQTVENPTHSTQLIDLYLENFHDKPMLYVVHLGTIVDSENIDLDFSQDLRNFSASSAKTEFKPRVLADISRKLLFYIEKERRLYFFMTKGLMEYGMFLEQMIENFKVKFCLLEKKYHFASGAFSFYLLTSRDYLEESELSRSTSDKWENINENLKNRKGKIDNAMCTIIRIHNSVCRRIRHAIECLKIPSEDELNQALDKSKADGLYEDTRRKSQKRETARHDVKDVKSVLVKFYKQRDALLHSTKLQRDQTELQNIHKEFRHMERIVDGLIPELEKFISNLNLNRKTQITEIVKMIHAKDIQMPKNCSPDQLKLELPRGVTATNTSNVFCFGEGDDAKSLIEDNKAILEAMEDLIEELKAPN